jgi:hypothetical protein
MAHTKPLHYRLASISAAFLLLAYSNMHAWVPLALAEEPRERRDQQDQQEQQEQQPQRGEEPTPAPTSAPTQAPEQTTSTEPTPAPTSAPTPTVAPESQAAQVAAPTPTTTPESQYNQTSDGQVGEAEVDTGDATTTGAITNMGNENVASQPTATGDAPSASLTNTGNGADSTNDIASSTIQNANTNQVNVADVNNSLELESVTGDNSASKNVGDATITTGDANVTGTIMNSVNTNVEGVAVAEFNIIEDQVGDYVLDFATGCIYGCGLAGDATLENSGNGADSDNAIDSTSEITDNTFQSNDADVYNGMTLVADSGKNVADKNTGGDTLVETGDANVTANVLTYANNNIAGNVIYNTVNIYGDLYGDIYLPEEYLTMYMGNTGNGSGSSNDTTLANAATTDITQTNNADIYNDLEIVTDTGSNETSGNTGGDSTVNTGDSTVQANVVNVVNSNITSDTPMWLVFVNEAGKWVGRLFGSPDGQNYAGSEGTEFTVNENGEVIVSNSGNGADSDNTANSTTTTETTITQENNASVNNELKLVANTGGNSASDNTGGDNEIKTGDAKVIANIVNFVNNNIIGSGRLIVTTVNVFGSWIGNFYGPGQKPATAQANEPQEQAQDSGIGGYVAEEMMETEDVAETDEEVASHVAYATSTNKTKKSSGQVAGITSGSDEPQSPLASLLNLSGNEPTEAEQVGDSVVSSAAAKKTVKINLAWIILAFPMILIGTLLRKRFITA